MTNFKALRRISVSVLAVLLLTMSVLSVTLAKYVTKFEGKAEITKSEWKIQAKVDNGSETTQTNLTLASEKKAHPGMEDITFTITVKNTGELDGEVALSLKDAAASQSTTETQYKIKATYKKDNSDVDITEDTKIDLAKSNGEVVITVTLSWEFGDTEDEAYSSEQISIPVTITVSQKNTNNSTT